MLSGKELKTLQKRSRIVGNRLANAETPFIRNCWYVAARCSEVTQKVTAKTLLGSSIILFRTENGRAAALQNRCCHRSFPLAEGTVEGESIRCGYHGLKFDTSGLCIEIPGQQKVSGRFGVRGYPLLEKPPFLWIWMGEPEAADPALCVSPEWLNHPDWDVNIDYLYIKGSYVGMHENLLDLSHLSYLHAKSFGTPEYGLAPCEIQIEKNDIQVWRQVECILPDLYAKPLGWQGMKALRRSGSQFISPALHINTGILTNLELPEDRQQPTPTVKVAQLVTPEFAERTHYYYAVCRNFARNDKAVDDFMLKTQRAAFGEDQFALEKITEMYARENPATLFEIDIATDAAGLEMRKRLKAMAAAEAAAENQAT